MKILIAIMLSFALVGCSTTKIIKADTSIEAPADIMQNCPEFVMPSGGSLADFVNTLIENKKVYEICNLQNDAKKQFIEKYTK